MSRSDTPPTRRAVLAAARGAPVAAGAALTGGEGAEAREVDDAGSPLLRDTEHTRAYYASARY